MTDTLDTLQAELAALTAAVQQAEDDLKAVLTGAASAPADASIADLLRKSDAIKAMKAALQGRLDLAQQVATNARIAALDAVVSEAVQHAQQRVQAAIQDAQGVRYDITHGPRPRGLKPEHAGANGLPEAQALWRAAYDAALVEYRKQLGVGAPVQQPRRAWISFR